MTKTYTMQPWVHKTNVYEVNLRQYTEEGTFQAFAKHLPRLASMGVETLWFMPITPVAKEKRKGVLGSYYATCDFSATNPEFGTLSDFKRLVKKAHKLGMKVIIDWVTNHTGCDHTWTRTNRDFYLFDEQGNFTERNGWDDVIDLDYRNAEMRNAMIEAMAFWVKKADIDGFRCDMAHLVPLEFWIAARENLDAIKPLFWLAECEEPAYHQAFDATYAWKWMHAAQAFTQSNQSMIVLDKVLYEYQDQYPPAALKLLFTSNHDENSWNGTEYEKYGPFAANLAVFSATWNGVPLVYTGQEIPNKRRLKFFDKDALTWPAKPELHDFYATLFALRKTSPALLNSHKEAFTYRINTGHERCLVYLRKHQDAEVLVMLNFTHEAVRLNINDHRLNGTFTNVFSSQQQHFTSNRFITVPASGFVVMQKQMAHA